MERAKIEREKISQCQNPERGLKIRKKAIIKVTQNQKANQRKQIKEEEINIMKNQKIIMEKIQKEKEREREKIKTVGTEIQILQIPMKIVWTNLQESHHNLSLHLEVL